MMIKALQLYSKFLKEFPKDRNEIGVELRFYLKDDGFPIMMLHLPHTNVVAKDYTGGMFRRVSEWFKDYYVALELANPSRGDRIYQLLKNRHDLNTVWALGILKPLSSVDFWEVSYVSK